MDHTVAAFVMVGLMVFLLTIGVPIAFAIGLVGVTGTYLFLGGATGLMQIPIVAYHSVDSFAFTALPLFVVMSQVLLDGKIGVELFAVARKWIGHWPGGMAVAAMAACAIFSAISGSSLATAATIGVVAVPQLLEANYDRKLITGSLAAGGTLGIMIPPSTAMILFGAMTGESIGQLFMAGVVPGLLLVSIFVAYIMIRALVDKNHVRLPSSTWKERFDALRHAIWGLLMPVLVIGGMYIGVFTPTEAAAVGFVYSLLVTLVIKRTLDVKGVMKSLVKGGQSTVMIFTIITAAVIFGHTLTQLRIIHTVSDYVGALPYPPVVVLLAICVLLLIAGMFFEVAAIILVMLPILFPIVQSLGINPIWFAMIFVLCVEFAYITPPVGMNLYILQRITNQYTHIPFSDVARGAFPFLLCMFLALALLFMFPSLATWLPSIMFTGPKY